MKTMKAVQKYHKLILDKTENQKPVKVSSITFVNNESDSFNHALQDLIIDGMIYYSSLNPELMIKRIA